MPASTPVISRVGTSASRVGVGVGGLRAAAPPLARQGQRAEDAEAGEEVLSQLPRCLEAPPPPPAPAAALRRPFAPNAIAPKYSMK